MEDPPKFQSLIRGIFFGYFHPYDRKHEFLVPKTIRMDILFVNVAKEIMILSTFLVFVMKISASRGKNVSAVIS